MRSNHWISDLAAEANGTPLELPSTDRSVQSTFRFGDIQNSATHCLDPEIVDFWIETPRVRVDEF